MSIKSQINMEFAIIHFKEVKVDCAKEWKDLPTYNELMERLEVIEKQLEKLQGYINNNT